MATLAKAPGPVNVNLARLFSTEFEGRPLIFQTFTLDLPNLVFAHTEALNHQLSGTGNVSPFILGMNKSEEDFLAPIFGKFLVVRLLYHGISLSWKQSGERCYLESKADGKVR